MKTKRLNILFLKDLGSVDVTKYRKDNKEHLAKISPKVPDEFYTTAYWDKQIVNAKTEFETDIAYRFMFLLKNKIIGNINCNQVFRGCFHACYIGYAIDSKYQGQGYMTEALERVIKIMFLPV